MAEEVTAAPVATAYTLEFVRRSLPDGARHVLEIGCGAGELAAALGESGLAVVAIDGDPECIAAARGRGVDARLIDWPAAIDGKFDAVLFTRSLHHIHELAEAVDAALAALEPGGRVIVEDFRAEGGSARSAEWFGTTIGDLTDGGLLVEGSDAAALMERIAPTHDHHLHSSAAIQSALEARCQVAATDAAYYFRYLEPWLRDHGAAQRLLEVELEQIEAGAIDPLGRRFVAVPPAGS